MHRVMRPFQDSAVSYSACSFRCLDSLTHDDPLVSAGTGKNGNAPAGRVRGGAAAKRHQD